MIGGEIKTLKVKFLQCDFPHFLLISEYPHPQKNGAVEMWKGIKISGLRGSSSQWEFTGRLKERTRGKVGKILLKSKCGTRCLAHFAAHKLRQ